MEQSQHNDSKKNTTNGSNSKTNKKVQGTLYLKFGLQALVDCKNSGELQTLSNKHQVSLDLNCHRSTDVMILIFGSEQNVNKATKDLIDLIRRVSPQYFSQMQTIKLKAK